MNAINHLKKHISFLLIVAVLSLSSPIHARADIGLSGLTRLLQQPVQEGQRRPQAELFIRTELFFGTGKPDGSEVSKEEFLHFLDTEITPRFPDGLTLLSGRGQFRDSSGRIVKEKAKLLILLYPIGAWSASSEKIEQIRELYKRAFDQQSVLRVDSRIPVFASF